MLIAAAKARGHSVTILNPLELVYGTHSSCQYDLIISRAEIDTFADNITDAYLRALDYFERLGVPIINAGAPTIAAQDKFRTLMAAHQAGIPVPLTFLVHSLENVQELIRTRQIAFPFFLKKPYSGCGHGVFLVRNCQELQATCGQHFSTMHEPILVEERIDLETDATGNVQDMRIWVVRDPLTNRAQFVGGATRTAINGHYLTNVSAGGTASPLPQPYAEDIIALSEKALESIDADVAGIDLARDTKGNLYLLEINISFYTSDIVQQIIGSNIWELVLDLAEARA
jgi:RimK family alpha-L-glutamate ligase